MAIRQSSNNLISFVSLLHKSHRQNECHRKDVLVVGDNVPIISTKVNTIWQQISLGVILVITILHCSMANIKRHLIVVAMFALKGTRKNRIGEQNVRRSMFRFFL